MGDKLSVYCFSAEPLERTAAILNLFRPVADQIVCAVDARVPERDLGALDGVVDVVRRCEVDPVSGIERCIPWVHSLCSGRWILRVDNDEVPSQALLRALPDLVEATDVVQYVLPVRWLFPDLGHFLNERPWSEDWHARLIRNTHFALRFPGRLHSDYEGVQPQRYLNLPLYHLNTAITSEDEREQKAIKYERSSPGLEAMPGWPTNNYYRPEKFQREPSAEVPVEDLQPIADVVNASGRTRRGLFGRTPKGSVPPTDIVTLQEVDPSWPLREIPESAFRASWRWVSSLRELQSGQPNQFFVEVSNDGTETWPWGDQHPAFRLSYRWTSADGSEIVAEGFPTTFTADVPPGSSILQPVGVYGPEEPGDYMIQFALVHEGTRWFAEGPAFWVSVK